MWLRNLSLPRGIRGPLWEMLQQLRECLQQPVCSISNFTYKTSMQKLNILPKSWGVQPPPDVGLRPLQAVQHQPRVPRDRHEHDLLGAEELRLPPGHEVELGHRRVPGTLFNDVMRFTSSTANSFSSTLNEGKDVKMLLWNGALSCNIKQWFLNLLMKSYLTGAWFTRKKTSWKTSWKTYWETSWKTSWKSIIFSPCESRLESQY